MDISAYRKRFETEIADSAPAPRIQGATSATAMAAAPPTAQPANESHISRLLADLRNADEPVSARIAALDGLKVARFLGEQFSPFRPAFLDVLRGLLDQAVDPALRTDAAEALASEKDPVVQDALRNGLLDPARAIVPAAKALQFLGYDDHADVAQLAGDVFRKTDDLLTKEAALRVMATDPASQDLLEHLMLDKSQPRSLRALGATGLNLLDPQRFHAAARDVVLDAGDFDEIRATSLGALANVAGRIDADATLLDHISALAKGDGPKALAAPAIRFEDGRR